MDIQICTFDDYLMIIHMHMIQLTLMMNWLDEF